MAPLTKTFVDKIKPAAKEQFFWDTSLPGFGLRVWPSGRKVYVAQYRLRGQTRRQNIGRHGTVTVQQARDRAREILAAAQLGIDPISPKAAYMAQLCHRYLAEHATKRKASTAKQYARYIEGHILPAFGHLLIPDVSRDLVSSWHAGYARRPVAGNRALAVLSHVFACAELWGMAKAGSNPARGVERFRERARERFLSFEEIARLGQTISDCERERILSPRVALCLRLIILTGARLGEMLSLKWEEINWDGLIRLEESKTGRKTIHLPSQAIDLLKAWRRTQATPFVFPGNIPGTHMSPFDKPWYKTRERAGLDDVRIHDLRHTFASVLTEMGLSLVIVGKALGHTQWQTTQRYAHLSADPVHQAVERGGSRIAEALFRGIA